MCPARSIRPHLEHSSNRSFRPCLFDGQEPDTSFLAPEYLEILENEEQIKSELKEQPGRLQFLYGIITDLYVDNYKFKGQNVTQHVPQLQRALEDYSLDVILAFFLR